MIESRAKFTWMLTAVMTCGLALVLSGCGGSSKPSAKKKKADADKTEAAEGEKKADAQAETTEGEKTEPTKESTGPADTKAMGDALKKAADMKKDIEKTVAPAKKPEAAPAKTPIVFKGEGADEQLAGKTIAQWLKQLNGDSDGDIEEALLALENAGHFEVVKANKGKVEELSKHANADISGAAKGLLEKMK